MSDDLASSDDPPATAAGGDEHVAIGHAVDRLAERFPMVPRDRIVDLVHARQLGFTGAPVRDFIPVLIEHDVKRELHGEVQPDA